jgi:hypothetical protein
MSTSTAATIWERGRLDTRVGPRQALFGRMYEDPSIELEAFRPGSRVLCIASAGCTAMKLAPQHDAVAVDINPVQLAYAERRFDGDPGVRGRAERIMNSCVSSVRWRAGGRRVCAPSSSSMIRPSRCGTGSESSTPGGSVPLSTGCFP